MLKCVHNERTVFSAIDRILFREIIDRYLNGISVILRRAKYTGTLLPSIVVKFTTSRSTFEGAGYPFDRGQLSE